MDLDFSDFFFVCLFWNGKNLSYNRMTMDCKFPLKFPTLIVKLFYVKNAYIL